jgi:hypothetical protein
VCWERLTKTKSRQDCEQRKCVWAGQVRCLRPTYVDASYFLLNTSTSDNQNQATTTQSTFTIRASLGQASLFVGQEQSALDITMSNLYERNKSTYAASKPSAAASPRATMKDNQGGWVLRHLHHTQYQSTRLKLRHALGSPSSRQVLARIS